MIPQYPDYAPINVNFRDELYPLLNMEGGGISEFTFAGLYLFRKTYQYELSWLPGGKLLIRGGREGRRFHSLPLGFPEDAALRKDVVQSVDYIKNLNEEQADSAQVWLESAGFVVCEDRDNFDYIYLREDLAALRGRKYHKKRNLVNGFMNSYSHEVRPLGGENIDDAFHVLEVWREQRKDAADYEASREALEMRDFLELDGCVVYVDGKPAAYTMGEGIARGTAYIIHVEKAIEQYRGIYQFINQAYAAMLPEKFRYINREQDLGNEGLRQAKMTYRPSGFVKKYRVCAIGSVQKPFHTLGGNEGRA